MGASPWRYAPAGTGPRGATTGGRYGILVSHRIQEILQRRPVSTGDTGAFREQLFWLVDLIYACKATGDAELSAQAAVVEDALASLGEFLETGNRGALRQATAQVDELAARIKTYLSEAKELSRGAAKEGDDHDGT